MSSFVSAPQVLDSLNWRYATKEFDSEKKIPSDQWEALERSLVLTPSSFGLQPWSFIVVQDQKIRERLVEHSWGQRQVVDASHLLVIAARTNVDVKWIDRFMDRLKEVRGEMETMGAYRDMMAGFIGNMDEAAILQWAKLQTYIALGQFMTATAVMGIDACPMEGFVADKYDEILGLKDKDLTASVLCPVGYRSASDKYASLPKVRFEDGEMIARI